jgi:ATP-binding cassette subfamily B (MDR/TAP) protein 1
MIARDMSGNKQIGHMVPYSKLYTFATRSDKLLLYIGWGSACITGCGMPSFVFLIGHVIDSFKPTTSVDDTIETISQMSLIFTLVGIAVWIFSLVMYSFLLLFSERVVKTTRVQYLKAILS